MPLSNPTAMIIQEMRKQNHLTQTALAKQIGVSRAAISQFESGDSKPSVETLQKLAAFFDVDMQVLLTGKQSLAEPANSSQYRPDRNAMPVDILSNIPTIKLRRLPFAGRASFNYPQIQRHQNTDVFEQVDFRIPKGRTPADYTDALVVDIEGDSMEKSLYDGDSVIAWPIPESKWEQLHNTICLVDYDDTATVKAIIKNDLFNSDSLTLVATGGGGGSFTVARASIHSIWEVRDFYEPRKVRLIV